MRTNFLISNNCYYRMDADQIVLLKRLEKKIDLLRDELYAQKKKEQLLGSWISEKEVLKLLAISRNTLLKLRNEGKVSRSTIAGKQNYYRLSDFKELLDKNEG